MKKQPAENTPVERYPALHSPQPSPIRRERLPEPRELKKTEIAFREEIRSERELAAESDRAALKFVVYSSLAMYVLPVAGAVVGSGLAVSLVLLSSVFLTFLLLWLRRITSLRHFFALLFLPVLSVIVVSTISGILEDRTRVMVPLMSMACAALLWGGSVPLRFYREWLFTHPRLRPETRRRRKFISYTPRFPNLLLLGLVCWSFLYLVPKTVGGSIALLWVVALVAGGSPIRSVQLTRRVLAHYLTYSGERSGAAGVWRPDWSIRYRKFALGISFLLFNLTLSEGLYFFVPGDWQPRLHSPTPATTAPVRKGVKTTRPAPRKAGNAQPIQQTPAKLSQVAGNNEFAAIRAALGEARNFSSGGFVLLLFSSLTALFLPTLLTIALYANALRQLEQLRAVLDSNTGSGVLDDDGRSKWEWYVDRIQTSAHEAVFPKL